MSFRLKTSTLCVTAVSIIVAALSWIQWGNWPNAVPIDPSWKPDLVLVLGGGDEARSREALRWHSRFPGLPIVVTGDGGTILRELTEAGVPNGLILHEQNATSTHENADFTDPIIDAMPEVRRVLLITNWFHAARSLAVFRKRQPEREFAVAFETASQVPNPWEVKSQRRERLAALFYLFRYGVNPFSP